MRFSLTKTYYEYIVFFGLSNSGSNNLLLIVSKNRQILDLILSNIFNNILLDYFIYDYIYQYDRNSYIIEFRLKNNLQVSLLIYQVIEKVGSFQILRRESRLLINSISSTVKYLSYLLEPLKYIVYIYIIFNLGLREVDIEILRL